MKEETKELVEWIIARLKSLKQEALESGTEISDLPPQYEQAFAFLDSLPEIESHLCRGGYIQDKNGTPCCDGDKIMQKVADKNEVGTLYWSMQDRCFYFKSDTELHIVNYSFVKVTKPKGE